jgi:GTP cyclohydrolase II
MRPRTRRSILILNEALDPVGIRNRVRIPLLDGEASGLFVSFTGLAPGEEHFAVALGTPDPDQPLVRVHSECITGDVFASQLCDCGRQLQEAIRRLARDGGYLVYLRQEGRGIGLYAKLDAYELQQRGFDTFEANNHLNYPDDPRDFGCAAAMLRALGVRRARLLTNNPSKVEQLERHGIAIAETIPTGVYVNHHNRAYLQAKIRKHRHLIALADDKEPGSDAA